MNTKFKRPQHQIKTPFKIRERNMDDHQSVNKHQSITIHFFFFLLTLLCTSFFLFNSQSAMAQTILDSDAAIPTTSTTQMSMTERIRFHDQLIEQDTVTIADATKVLVWDSTKPTPLEDSLLQIQLSGKEFIMFRDPKLTY